MASKWDLFGVKLEVPYKELNVIRSDCGQDARRCMMKMMEWWLDNDLEPKWSTIVQALAKIGKRNLAYEIALNHGLYKLTYKGLMECKYEREEGGRE